MTRTEFLRSLEESLEVAPGTLDGNPKLEELEFWDSMSALIYIALADEKLQQTVTGNQIAGCKTIDDLLGLLGPNLQG